MVAVVKHCPVCGKQVASVYHPDAVVYHMECLKKIIKTLEERKKDGENLRRSYQTN